MNDCIDVRHQPRPQHINKRRWFTNGEVNVWVSLLLQNGKAGGYGWTRTTDLSIMSAAL